MYKRIYAFWGDSSNRARVYKYLALCELVIIALAATWIVRSMDYDTEWTAEELSNGGWCQVVGKEITVTVPELELDDWCCTVNGDVMTFLNTGPFEFGKKESYTRFGGVSFITGMYEALQPYDGKSVLIRGRLQSYLNAPQIIIDSPAQVEEIP